MADYAGIKRLIGFIEFIVQPSSGRRESFGIIERSPAECGR